jgi:hypothetical protein
MNQPPDPADIVGLTRMEWQLLHLLLERSDDWPWCPITEVVGESTNPIVALDAMAALGEVGLIQRRDGYVMITRAALRFYQLITWP